MFGDFKSKKRFFALAIAGITLAMASFPVSAAELRQRTEATIHPWNEFVDSLDPGDYSGVYVENDQLHIAAMDEPQMMRLVSRSRAADSIAVVEAEKYSYQQLLDAQNFVDEKHVELGVSAIYLEPKNNNLVVKSKSEWTDERKQAVRDCAKIDNIVYELTTELQYDIEESENATTRDVPRYDEVVNGDLISSSAGGRSVGCGIRYTEPGTSRTAYGYLTAGHGLRKGDSFKYYGDPLGNVAIVKNQGYLDVAIIKEPSSPVLYQSEHLLANQSMTQTGNPLDQDTLWMFGQRSYQNQGQSEFPRFGRVIRLNGIEYTEDGVVFKGLVEADYGRYPGDSGAPVTTIRGGQYVLVGIHKGYIDDVRVFTNFRDIRNTYGVNLVY